jgi:cysteine synthase A
MIATLPGPTYEEMLHPHRIDPAMRARGRTDGRAGLFDIAWRDAEGRPYVDVLPRELTGVDAPIAVLYGRDMPTGSHKVGAAYSVLAEAVLAEGLEPGKHTCIWPSTGNYGIGGAWVARQLGFGSIVALPETMSAERFALLRRYGSDIATTPGSESSARQVFDRCQALVASDPARMRVLNQFESFGNYRFHYYVTGNTIAEIAAELGQRGIGRGRVAAFASAMGSGGTIAAGDRLKQLWSDALVVGVEPIQCPTLSRGGFGDHQIQGIGDKHVTWIHHVHTMDAMVAVDDRECLLGLQLLTEEAGWKVLTQRYGVPEDAICRIATYVGISGVCNILAAIKTARYFGLSGDGLIVTVCTDTIDRYRSTMEQLTDENGAMDEVEAAVRLESIFHRQKTDWVLEATHALRRRWHDLKYYTWVEQLGKSEAELAALADPEFWLAEQAKVADVDRGILALR